MLPEVRSGIVVSKPSYLTAQLRESVPYLQDAGWRQTATLLLAAADEIEGLRSRLEQVERGAVLDRPRREASGTGRVVR